MKSTTYACALQQIAEDGLHESIVSAVREVEEMFRLSFFTRNSIADCLQHISKEIS